MTGNRERALPPPPMDASKNLLPFSMALDGPGLTMLPSRRLPIIGFDGWTKGSHHYERLVEAFASKSLDLKLVHIGSWGNEFGRPQRERIGNLNVVDISFYGQRPLATLLAREKPAAVIFLSTEAFAHRAFLRYCRQANVPTLHLFHGLHGAIDFRHDVYVNPCKRLWQLRAHVPKLLFHSIPAYALALKRTNAGSVEWRRLALDIVERLAGRRGDRAASDSKADRACVYTDSEIDYAVSRYGYRADEVSAVGNPDLIHFGMPSNLIGRESCPSRFSEKDVMYIDSGLLDSGIVYGSAEQFAAHMADTTRHLAAQGKHLVFKPHPVHLGSPVLKMIANAGVEICHNNDFVARLQRCCASIVEPSSAALIPALMGMPLFLAQYSGLGAKRFGKLLKEYPRTMALNTLSDFSSQLSAQRSIDPKLVQRWVLRHSGPLPAEMMPARVADVVDAMARGARAT